MSEKFFDCMLSIIIGDKQSNFDGYEERQKRIEGDYHHVMAYKTVIDKLRKKGYDLSNFIENDKKTEITEFMRAGHILMLNVSQNNLKQSVVYLPKKLTKKQLRTFKEYLEELKENNNIVVTLDDNTNNGLDLGDLSANKVKKILKSSEE